MNNKLICPFCGEEIISDLCLMCDKIDKGYTSGRQIYKCNKCSLFGNKELWQALIQSQKDFEMVKRALTDIFFICEQDASKDANARISEIYAIAKKILEHKE